VSSPERPIRVLLSKPGLDGHDRGIKVIIRALWEAGMEVIYTGMRVSPEAIALAAVQEDVDAVGVSNHSGAYDTLFPQVVDALDAHGVERNNVVIFCGGAIPPTEAPKLRSIGFDGVFPPGTSLDSIISFLRREVANARS